MDTAETLPKVPELHITDQDMKRLREVVDRHTNGNLAQAAESLEWELDRARVVPQAEISPDVVTMRSRVVCDDVENGKRRELILVYPSEADSADNKVSVLAPIGMALLGLQVGASIRWSLPGGRSTTFKVISVSFQPEAHGEFEL
jgi:regulator of nucleoside diphosphate kinase